MSTVPATRPAHSQAMTLPPSALPRRCDPAVLAEGHAPALPIPPGGKPVVILAE